jgi:hypothetical protein
MENFRTGLPGMRIGETVLLVRDTLRTRLEGDFEGERLDLPFKQAGRTSRL